MSKQIQEAYIVAATCTPVGKAPRGMLRNAWLGVEVDFSILIRNWRPLLRPV